MIETFSYIIYKTFYSLDKLCQLLIKEAFNLV